MKCRRNNSSDNLAGGANTLNSHYLQYQLIIAKTGPSIHGYRRTDNLHFDTVVLAWHVSKLFHIKIRITCVFETTKHNGANFVIGPGLAMKYRLGAVNRARVVINFKSHRAAAALLTNS